MHAYIQWHGHFSKQRNSNEHRFHTFFKINKNHLTSKEVHFRFQVNSLPICLKSLVKVQQDASSVERHGKSIWLVNPQESCMNRLFQPCWKKAKCFCLARMQQTHVLDLNLISILSLLWTLKSVMVVSVQTLLPASWFRHHLSTQSSQTTGSISKHLLKDAFWIQTSILSIFCNSTIWPDHWAWAPHELLCPFIESETSKNWNKMWTTSRTMRVREIPSSHPTNLKTRKLQKAGWNHRFLTPGAHVSHHPTPLPPPIFFFLTTCLRLGWAHLPVREDVKHTAKTDTHTRCSLPEKTPPQWREH